MSFDGSGHVRLGTSTATDVTVGHSTATTVNIAGVTSTISSGTININPATELNLGTTGIPLNVLGSAVSFGENDPITLFGVGCEGAVAINCTGTVSVQGTTSVDILGGIIRVGGSDQPVTSVDVISTGGISITSQGALNLSGATSVDIGGGAITVGALADVASVDVESVVDIAINSQNAIILNGATSVDIAGGNISVGGTASVSSFAVTTSGSINILSNGVSGNVDIGGSATTTVTGNVIELESVSGINISATTLALGGTGFTTNGVSEFSGDVTFGAGTTVTFTGATVEGLSASSSNTATNTRTSLTTGGEVMLFNVEATKTANTSNSYTIMWQLTNDGGSGLTNVVSGHTVAIVAYIGNTLTFSQTSVTTQIGSDLTCSLTFDVVDLLANNRLSIRTTPTFLSGTASITATITPVDPTNTVEAAGV